MVCCAVSSGPGRDRFHSSPHISDDHRPAAPCPHHQSVPATASLINDDLRWRDKGWGTLDTRLKRGTGVAVWATRAVPRCNSATVLWVASVLRGREKGEFVGVSEGRGRRVPVTFKFRGSGTGSHTAPAGNVTPSDVSRQAKYNLVSTWKDVL